jgi:predicted phosphoadenosine phosphosulfate sulfurtransferase
MIGNMTLQMKEKIDEVYPVHDMQGNDAAVLMACDEVYDMYQQSGMQNNAMCIATLYRATMSGIIVKKSTPLKTYRF